MLQTYDVGSVPSLVATLRDLFDRYAGIKALISTTVRNELTLEAFTRACGLFAKRYPSTLCSCSLPLQTSINSLLTVSMYCCLNANTNLVSSSLHPPPYIYTRSQGQMRRQTPSQHRGLFGQNSHVSFIVKIVPPL